MSQNCMIFITDIVAVQGLGASSYYIWVKKVPVTRDARRPSP
jgi:hypothetical protein